MIAKKPYYQALADANQRAAAMVQAAVVAISERTTAKTNVSSAKKDKKITAAYLREIGARAYRSGTHRAHSINYAAVCVDRELTAAERHEVLTGFAAARERAVR